MRAEVLGGGVRGMTSVVRHVDFEVGDWGEFSSGPTVRLSYRNAVMGMGPVGYWRLGETSGSVAGDETGNHDGVYGSGVMLGQSGALAWDGDGAVRSDGSVGTTVLSTSSAFEMASFTVVFWAWADVIKDRIVVLKANGVTAFNPTAGWTVRTDSPSDTVFMNVRTSGGLLIGTAAPIVTGRWYAFAFEMDGPVSRLRTYADGELIGESEKSGGIAYAGVGDLWMMPQPFDFEGAMDELAVFDRALSGDEVRALYRLGVGR